MPASIRITVLLVIMAASIASWFIYDWSDNRVFKAQIIEQSAAVDALVKVQESALNETVQAVDSAVQSQTVTIDTMYRQYLDDVISLHNSAAGNSQQMPSAASAAGATGQTTPGKSPGKDSRLSQKLLKCESKLLYEAREYDILATHYNALLKIYEYSKSQNNKGGDQN